MCGEAPHTHGSVAMIDDGPAGADEPKAAAGAGADCDVSGAAVGTPPHRDLARNASPARSVTTAASGAVVMAGDGSPDVQTGSTPSPATARAPPAPPLRRISRDVGGAWRKRSMRLRMVPVSNAIIVKLANVWVATEAEPSHPRPPAQPTAQSPAAGGARACTATVACRPSHPADCRRLADANDRVMAAAGQAMPTR